MGHSILERVCRCIGVLSVPEECFELIAGCERRANSISLARSVLLR